MNHVERAERTALIDQKIDFHLKEIDITNQRDVRIFHRECIEGLCRQLRAIQNGKQT